MREKNYILKEENDRAQVNNLESKLKKYLFMYTEEEEKYDNFDIINKLYMYVCIYEGLCEREKIVR
jgi:hypothetical protein